MDVIELVIKNVKDEIRYTTKRYFDLINEYPKCANVIIPGDILNGSVYKRIRIKNEKQLTLLLHTDGAPVIKIGGKSLWPVQATIAEVVACVQLLGKHRNMLISQ